MGIFDKQIRDRLNRDQENLEESFFKLASVVMDKWDQEAAQDMLVITKGAFDEILKFYRQKPVDIPKEIIDLSDRMEYAFRPAGLMTRDVKLTGRWYMDAFGPMLCHLKESNYLVALIPSALGGYHYKHPVTGKKIKINKRTAAELEEDAVSFFQSLPMKKIGIKELLVFIKKSMTTSDLLVVIIATLLLVIVSMLEPNIYKLITGPIMDSKQMPLLIGAVIFLASASFATLMIDVIRKLLVARVRIKAICAVDSSIMMRILSLPVSFFREHSSGDLAKRVKSVSNLTTVLVDCGISTGLTSIISLLYVRQISNLAPSLVVPSLIIIIASVLLSVIVALVQLRINKKQMAVDAEEAGLSYSVINGMQKIKLTGAEKRVFAKWANVYARKASLQYDPPLLIKISPALQLAISVIGTIVLYYIAVKSEISMSEYYAFNAAYGKLSAAFVTLAGVAIALAGIKPVMDLAEPILKTEPEVNSDKKMIDRISGKVEFSHVIFRYDDDLPYIVNDMSFKIKAGEYIAIVGKSGCGKSTLIRLLLGFDKPERGAVYYDQYDLNQIDPRTLRRKIGVVLQDGQLFEGDIFSNIAIAAPHLTEEEAWEAAEIAGIAEDIRQMPLGMHTIISAGQSTISGGQRQRLLIARAIAPKPKILILDEATSALDDKTQRQVSEALDRYNATKIVIAHRLSTIRNVDRILMISEGRIIEEGSYDELMELNGEFKALVERQNL